MISEPQNSSLSPTSWGSDSFRLGTWHCLLGLALANPDPDGRPISAIAWPNNPVVQSQSPGPGSVLYRNDSLRVWLRIDREPDMAHKLDEPPPSVDWEHATSDKPTQKVELSSDDPGDEPAR